MHNFKWVKLFRFDNMKVNDFKILLIDVTFYVYYPLKHTTTLFSLSDHYILSWEWRVIVDQAQTNYHGRPMTKM